jgi:hypothetical protein
VVAASRPLDPIRVKDRAMMSLPVPAARLNCRDLAALALAALVVGLTLLEWWR